MKQLQALSLDELELTTGGVKFNNQRESNDVEDRRGQRHALGQNSRNGDECMKRADGPGRGWKCYSGRSGSWYSPTKEDRMANGD
jgi:hypothetical protein